VHYLALFNTEDQPAEIVFDLSRLNLGDKTVACRDLWTRRDLGPVSGNLRQVLPAHGSALLRLKV
jgi:alpha-galactosidase